MSDSTNSTTPRENFFTPIGRVVAVFNEIETALVILAGGMCLSEFNAVTALMAEASFRRKVDGIQCICDWKIQDQEKLEELDNVLKRLLGVEVVRNQVCHTFWSGTSAGNLMKMKWTAKRKQGNRPNLRIT